MKKKLFFKIAKQAFTKNWKQFIALIIIGVISITLFVGLIANAKSFKYRFDYMYEKGNMSDLFITVDPKKKVDPNDLGNIKNIIGSNGIVEDRFYCLGSAGIHTSLFAISDKYPTLNKAVEYYSISEKQTDDYFFLVDYMNSVYNDSDINVSRIETTDVIDIVFDSSFFEIDESTINKLDSFLLPGAKNPFKEPNIVLKGEVTGIVHTPEAVAKTQQYSSTNLMSKKFFKECVVNMLKERFSDLGVYVILKYGLLDTLGWGDGTTSNDGTNFPPSNQYVIKLNNPKEAEKYRKLIIDYYESKADNNLYLIQSLDDKATHTSIENDVNNSYKLAYVFPAVFFMVTFLILIATMRQIVVKDRIMIGTLAGIGFTKKEIYLYYFLLIGVIVGVSSIIGIIVGPMIIPGLLNKKYHILYNMVDFKLQFPFIESLLTLIFVLGVSALIVFLAMRKTINLKPADSLRPAPPTIKSHRLNKKEDFNQKSVLTLSLRMSIRDIANDLVKTMMVIIGVLGCVMILVCGNGIEDMCNYGINNDSYISTKSEITLIYLTDMSLTKTTHDFRMNDEDGTPLIGGYQPCSLYSCDVYNESKSYKTNLGIIGDYISYDGSSYNYYYEDLHDDKVIITEAVAKALNIKIGDTVSFTFLDKEITAEVENIYYEFYGNGVFLKASSPLIGEELTSYNGAFIHVSDKNNVTYVQDKIKESSYIATAYTSKDYKSLLDKAMQSITILTKAVKAFGIALAAVVLYNICLMNFNDKIREIATLKVLGFKKREITLSLILSIILTTIVGTLFGLLCGKPFMKLVLYINRVELVDFNSHIDFSTYIASFLFSVVISLTVNILLSFRIKKVAMIESLKTVE